MYLLFFVTLGFVAIWVTVGVLLAPANLLTAKAIELARGPSTATTFSPLVSLLYPLTV